MSTSLVGKMRGGLTDMVAGRPPEAAMEEAAGLCLGISGHEMYLWWTGLAAQNTSSGLVRMGSRDRLPSSALPVFP